MRPALEDGDWLLAQRFRGTPSRGDIMVFAPPGEDQIFVIKRVIGLPGEHAEISDGQVHIDGHTLAEPWANGPTFPYAAEHISDDAVWVLGDNRALSSADSRTIGALPIAAIEWKAVAIYWPSRRVGLL